MKNDVLPPATIDEKKTSYPATINEKNGLLTRNYNEKRRFTETSQHSAKT